MRISDWSSDVCSSDLDVQCVALVFQAAELDEQLAVMVALINHTQSAGHHRQYQQPDCKQARAHGVSSGMRSATRSTALRARGLDANSALSARCAPPRLRDRKSTRLNSSHYCASRLPAPACKKNTHNQ